MPTERYEYRVRWRREGRQRTSHIYQTRRAAERKARGILALEEVKADTSMADMPDLAEKPSIEAREVCAWAPVMPTPEATDEDRDAMRAFFTPSYDDEVF